MNILQLSWPPS